MSKFKVGDKVRRINYGHPGKEVGEVGVVDFVHDGGVHLAGEDPSYSHQEANLVLLDVPAFPVRTKTVTEIVEGVYGRISIKQQGGDEPRLLIALANPGGHVEMTHHGWSLNELSEAITNLTAIRDALQEQDK